jgi:hypothetical protein
LPRLESPPPTEHPPRQACRSCRWSPGKVGDVEIRNNMKLPAAARLVPAAWR